MRKSFRLYQLTAAALACATWVLPAQALAQVPDSGVCARQAPSVHGDIRLGPHGSLRGRLIDGQGQPVGAVRLQLSRSGQPVAETLTNRDGRFALGQLGAGVYQLRVGETVLTCRVWTREAAPPAARDELLLVDAPQIVRGQQPIGAVFSNPLFLGLIVATAIAVPIAVHNSDNDQPAGS